MTDADDAWATLERQIDTERWTNLDRQLARDGYRTGVIDLAPHPNRQPDEFHALKVGRLRKLESLGLADQVGPGQWTVSENAETTLREAKRYGRNRTFAHDGKSPTPVLPPNFTLPERKVALSGV